jgi:hypothetical protein
MQTVYGKKMLTMVGMLMLTIDEVSSLASELCEEFQDLGKLGRGCKNCIEVLR